MCEITLKENEQYQELDLYVGDTKIGEAEVELASKMIARIAIYEPYQNKGYGKKIIKLLYEKYGCNNLWVRADNEKAIHVYEKCGYKKCLPTMYEMRLDR